MAVVGELRHTAVTVDEAAHQMRTVAVVKTHRLVALPVDMDAQPAVLVYVDLAGTVGIGDAGEVSVVVVAVARDASFGVCGAVRLHELRVAVARLVAQGVGLRYDELFRGVAVGRGASGGVGHEVMALFRMVLYASLHHAVLAVGVDAPSLAVVFPEVGVAVAVGLLRHQVARIGHLRGLAHCIGDACHVAVTIVGVRHQPFRILVPFEVQ